MQHAQPAAELIAPQTLEHALALLAQRDAELAALRAAQQDWVYAVSHDLRAPLRHVLAFAPMVEELLQSSNPGADDLAEARSFLQTMDQSAQRMAAMFDGLLALSRAARQPLQLQAVNLQQLRRSVEESLQPTARIEWSLPDECPGFQADVPLLQQALGAALFNAIKFSSTTTDAQIKVQVHRDDAPRWWITVSDNGVGFDDSRAQRLFGLFQRMHRETEFEGAGTGLALVRGICRRHGGDAEIVAKPGQGCQLRMWWSQAL